MAQRVIFTQKLIQAAWSTGAKRGFASGGDSILKFPNTGNRPLFALKTIKKHYEVAPLFIIVLGGIAILSGFVARNAFTRDDVRYMTKSKMICEQDPELENPRRRKFIIFNQQYNTPEGLKELYKE